ncbi:MAG: TaqI-like C-terminal specificity domain-containing protein, partial [bacterium]
MLTREDACLQIQVLVTRFSEQIESYRSGDYNETLTRRDYIDPFFRALGWDIDNSQGYAEAYREVIHEDKVSVGGAIKAPDYSFRLPGGKRLFFVEAKKPKVDIKNDLLPAYQVRRYGWSARLPVSVITDFEEFSVYDCTRKPLPTDNPAVSRVRYLTWKDYLNEFDFLWDTFSKERVLKGSFDRFVKSDTARKGTATVDKEFLISLDEWRKFLAVAICKSNPGITEEEVSFSVQRILDRVIFLRIAEDRNIEPYGNLKSVTGLKDVYGQLLALFFRADEKYNSGIFDMKKDSITPYLKMDPKVIINIINEFYYPVCPYEFSVFPVEILGSVYEQFLGKQIRITEGHRVKIDEKPEVRKAGGVYYTPQYIVDYIVKQSVGKTIDGKSPEQIASVSIVDPACGSGSFLLGAYGYLLDHYRVWYTNHPLPSRSKKEQPLTPDGQVTSAVKKQILTRHIFGVDIDANAVEVTKLSLLLKCMEGETLASIQQQFDFWNERILPSIDDNIRSGNSLVDLDLYDQEFDFGDIKKIKPFSWEKNFPQVFSRGGFDVVIGNPPYVRQELLGDLKNYFRQKYRVYHGTADLYSYFFERGIGLLNDHGIFGIIVANKWMRAAYGEPLRKWLKNQNIKEITDFGDLQVFQGATTYPSIFICGKGPVEPAIGVTTVKTLEFDSLPEYISENRTIIDQSSLDDSGWNLGSESEQQLLSKIRLAGIPLGEYVKGKIYRGVLTGLNEAFVIDEATRQRLVAEDPRSAGVIKPFLAGRDIKRYQVPVSDKYLIFTRRGIRIDQYPAIKNYLLQFKKQLMPRPLDFQGDKWPGRKPGSYKWYEIQDAVDYYPEFEKPKILFAEIATKGQFTPDETNFYSDTTSYILGTADKFLLGILNSNVCNYFFSKISSSIRGGFFRWKRQYVELIPIVKINQQEELSNSLHATIISNVDLMLQLNKELKLATLPDQKEQLSARIGHTDEKINRLVYHLYGLTDEEILMVENF